MKQAKKDVQPNWHPDFRVPEELPDIKVVRTDFLINGIALAVVFFLAVFAVQRELQARAVANQINDIQDELSEARSTNEENLALNNRFKKAIAKVEDLDVLYAAPYVAHRFLAEVDLRLPEGLRLYLVRGERVITNEKNKEMLRHRTRLGGEVTSLEVLAEFKSILEELVQQRPDFVPAEGALVQERPGDPDELTGIYPFTVEIEFERDPSAN